MNKHLTNTSRLLRILGDSFTASASSDTVNELRAIPHIQYFRDFDRIEWSPSVLGLDDVLKGNDPTLVCAPKWAIDWLGRTDFLRQNRWDISFQGLLPHDPWSRLEAAPSGMKIGSGFVEAGGFLNYWEDENKTHIVWGWVDHESAASVLAFVWLQNVLAGGRPWRRREIRNLSDAFMEALPIGYLCIPGVSTQSVSVRALGVHRPIFETNNGKLLGMRDWLCAPRAMSMSADIEEGSFQRLYLPESPPMPSKLSGDQAMRCGVVWKRVARAPSRIMCFYPSGFGMRIDSYQQEWKNWLDREVPELDAQRKTEVLLCIREAAINADKHGCEGSIGKRVGVIVSHDAHRHMIKISVSDPGIGHRYNLNAPLSRQDQRLGRHLGLMLIHGLASVVRFSDEGSTIEFDFTY